MISNYRKGFLRDNQIMSSIDRYKVLTTDQIELMFFRNIKNGKRMAQKRLKRLTEMGYLKRERFYFDQPYCYWIPNKKPILIQHAINTNWVYIWKILRMNPNWVNVYEFQHEKVYGDNMLRCDGFLAIKNNFDKNNNWNVNFIEVDLSWNKFDKVKKYNDFYISGIYLIEWWAGLIRTFPTIMVVTSHRVDLINKLIVKQNKNNLKFEVYHLDDIKGECMKWKSSRSSQKNCLPQENQDSVYLR